MEDKVKETALKVWNTYVSILKYSSINDGLELQKIVYACSKECIESMRNVVFTTELLLVAKGYPQIYEGNFYGKVLEELKVIYSERKKLWT